MGADIMILAFCRVYSSGEAALLVARAQLPGLAEALNEDSEIDLSVGFGACWRQKHCSLLSGGAEQLHQGKSTSRLET